jgi:Kelch motif protein
MRSSTVLSAGLAVAILACTSEDGPTEPEAGGAMTPAAPTVAAAVDIWRERGPHPFGTVIGPPSESWPTRPVGGFHGSQPVADLDVYDPATDTWTSRAPTPTAGRAIGTALQGKLYVLAGLNAYVYNPGTKKWSSIAAPTWGHDGVVRVVINGKPKLLAVGAVTKSPTSCTRHNAGIFEKSTASRSTHEARTRAG